MALLDNLVKGSYNDNSILQIPNMKWLCFRVERKQYRIIRICGKYGDLLDLPEKNLLNPDSIINQYTSIKRMNGLKKNTLEYE